MKLKKEKDLASFYIFGYIKKYINSVAQVKQIKNFDKSLIQNVGVVH
jgi:hypothetical protein